ncbi:hypothetical protein, partial [Escherichia coli]|uniref:hypothetical protein n=1 Tax=Escherichia coli TaxID=562 RepID=UPI001BC861CF
GLTALSAEFTIGEGELMAHDVPLGCAPDEYDDLISGTCSHLPFFRSYLKNYPGLLNKAWSGQPFDFGRADEKYHIAPRLTFSL